MQQTWISRDFFLAMQFSLKTFLEILDVIQVQLQKIFSPNMYKIPTDTKRRISQEFDTKKIRFNNLLTIACRA